MPKVLISDSMSSVAQKIFEKNNISVDVKTALPEEEIIKIIPEYDGMVVRSATKVTKSIIEAAKNLKVIGRAGAGVDNIDISSAKEKNMIVMNTPGGNANATAEHTFALIMSVLTLAAPFSARISPYEVPDVSELIPLPIKKFLHAFKDAKVRRLDISPL